MASRLTVIHQGFKQEHEVEEDFDTVLENLYPVREPASRLEGRQTMLYHDAQTGARILLSPNVIAQVEEIFASS